MSCDQQSGIQIDFHHAINPPLVESDMLFGGNSHEIVRRECFGIDPGTEFPFLPAIVVFGGGQAKRRERLWFGKFLVSPFAGEEATQERVIRLANDNHQIILLLNNHNGPF